MHKGHRYERVIPYTACANWFNDGSWGRYLSINGTFLYNNRTDAFNFVKTGKARNPSSPVQFVWDFSFKIGFFDFSGRIGISPEFSSPDNFVEVQVVDAFGNALTTTWRVAAGSFDPSGVFATDDWPVEGLTATGGFNPIVPLFNIVKRDYSEVP